MGITLPPVIRLAIMDPDTVKILATIDKNGVPHLSFQNSLRLRGDSELEYDEFHDNSINNMNMFHAVWANKIIILNLRTMDWRGFKVAAKPKRAVTSGEEFLERSQAVKTARRGSDLGTVWVIEPLSYIEVSHGEGALAKAKRGSLEPIAFRPERHREYPRLPLSFI
jgi:hypothetical protein